MERTDFAKGPALEQPFGAVGRTAFQFLSGSALRLSVAAQLDVVQQDPTAWLQVWRQPKHIEQRPGMTMIGIDEGEPESAGRGDIANDIGFPAGVNAHCRNEVANQLGDLETD